MSVLLQSASSQSAMSRPMGTIKLIIGPMYSGKTSELLTVVQRCDLSKNRRTCTLIKYIGDTRYDDTSTVGDAGTASTDGDAGTASTVGDASTDGDASTVGDAKKSVSTHDARRGTAQYVVGTLSELSIATDVIAVDEGQFFPDLVECAMRWRAEGRHVVIAALNATATQVMFPVIAQLLPHVNEISYHSAVCMGCGCDAVYSKRLPGNVLRHDASQSGDAVQPDIGGIDKYTAVCHLCLPD
jgi:thymidine kinase